MKRWRTLISASDLASHLGADNWCVVDTRFDLADPASGRRAYAAEHIPGAVYAHLDEDLAGPVRADTGRHPLPDPEALATKLATWGFDDRAQWVAYDDGSGAYAARFWWLARWLGHDATAVLDGGLAAWRPLHLPLTSDLPAPRTGRVSVRLRPWLAISTGELVERLAADEVTLIDARAAPRFRGEVEPIDARAGHVPGAVNYPFQQNLAPDGRFLAALALRERHDALRGERAPHALVSMCGSGVTACHNLLALEHAGLPGARLYVGSWSEWIRDSRRPIAVGDA